MKAKIRLNGINDVKDYISKAMRVDGDITISHGKYVINGKSLMGIFSLDLEEELNIEFNNLSNTDVDIITSMNVYPCTNN